MEGANVTTLLIAFVGGLASFLSPCVLPLVPGYISLMSGVSIDHLKGETASEGGARRAVIINSLAFSAGLSLIFISLGAAAGFIGAVLTNRWVAIVGGLVIVVFGLHLMGVLKIGALYRDTRKFSDEKPRGPVGSLVLGVAFAAGWTPCIGPILAAILAVAARSGGWRSGILLMSFYAAGLAVPFLLTGLGINKFLGFYSRFRRHLHKVEVFSGAMLILIGLMVATGTVTRLSSLAANIPFNPETWVERWWKKKGGDTQQQQKQDGGAAANNNAAVAFLPPLPDAEFKTLEGKSYHLSDLKGQVVILNFWATWCGPCRGEIPEFNAMQREHASQGLTIVGVTSHDTPEQVKTFQRDIPQQYTILLGSSDTPERFQNGPGLPVTYIIDRDGRVRHKLVGPSDREGFEALVRPLLEEQTTAATLKVE
jgi:cytochrome c-type biogenesis protein